MRALTGIVVVVVGFALSGCSLAALGAAASISGAVYTIAHNTLQVGEDVIKATAIACQELPAAKRVEHAKIVAGALRPQAATAPWYDQICNDLRPSNSLIDASTPVWIGEGIGRMKAATPPPASQRAEPRVICALKPYTYCEDAAAGDGA